MLFFCPLLIIFKIHFFKKIFQEYDLSVNQIASRSSLTFFFVGPDLGLNCLQRLSADNTRDSPFLARGNFCHQLITFANSLDPDKDAGPDLDPNCLIL